MNKEELRKIFGESGDDADPTLAEMFGPAYLDHPEDVHDTPIDLVEACKAVGIKMTGVGALERAIEMAAEISCIDNRAAYLRHLMAYCGKAGGEFMTLQQCWETMKHMGKCDDSLCLEVYAISEHEADMAPEAFWTRFGVKIRKLLSE